MSSYRVVMRADVMCEVDVEADSEEEAEQLAYESIGDNYEVDFVAESVECIDDGGGSGPVLAR